MPKMCPFLAAGIMMEARQIVLDAKRASARSGRVVEPDLKEHRKAMQCVEAKCQMWDEGVPDVRDPRCGLTVIT